MPTALEDGRTVMCASAKCSTDYGALASATAAVPLLGVGPIIDQDLSFLRDVASELFSIGAIDPP